jgi:tetratricopeptide (TPR) repeat protein
MHRFEAPVPLSQSMIWSLQSRSYQAGLRAWESGTVPSHMSSNAFLAQRYAKVIEGYARDLGPKAGPLTILELGGGSGRLAFYMLRNLERIWQAASGSLPPFRYVVTDFAAGNIEEWLGCGVFDDFIRRRLVDFAQFDADLPGPLTLRFSGDQIEADGQLPNLVVIANYVVDTLRQDQFHVEDGVLSEVRVAAASEQPAELSDPEILGKIELDREYAPAQMPYYNDPVLDAMLERYQNKLKRSNFLLPVAFINTLRFLARTTAGPMLGLVGDRGYRSLVEMEDLPPASLTRHGEYFTMPGNFDSLGALASAHKGGAFISDDVDRLFIVGGFLFGSRTAAMPETGRAFRHAVGDGGLRDLYGLLRNLADVARELPPSAALFALRLSNYDPRTMMMLSSAIEKAARNAPRQVRESLIGALDRVAENHYPLGSSRDMIYRQGRLYQQFEAHDRALGCFEKSATESGDHYMRHYRIAQCHAALGEIATARQHLDRCLTEAPDFDRGKALRSKLKRV